MFPTEFTEQELNDWLDSLDIHYSFAIIEKLYKDFRDYTFSLHAFYEAHQSEVK